MYSLWKAITGIRCSNFFFFWWIGSKVYGWDRWNRGCKVTQKRRNPGTLPEDVWLGKVCICLFKFQARLLNDIIITPKIYSCGKRIILRISIWKQVTLTIELGENEKCLPRRLHKDWTVSCCGRTFKGICDLKFWGLCFRHLLWCVKKALSFLLALVPVLHSCHPHIYLSLWKNDTL